MSRGELRIYLGAAPGVGKTYAMLDEGYRRRSRGADVVVGIVETHGRPRTAAQLRDLEVIPRRMVAYRDTVLEELDVEAVLARRPQVVLVDELAHTNAPGSANAKRWQDVEQLLDAGINVVSTVNVQHLESVNDVVERITGVRQLETVPDVVVRRAEQVELVDMTPEALRRRMAHGNIYAAERIDAALANYFRPGNLAALRELALLWVADRVDDSLQDYLRQRGIDGTWETRERIVVAVSGAPGGRELIRRAARLAARVRADLVAVHVAAATGLRRGDGDELDRQAALVRDLGGSFHQIVDDDPAKALAAFARGERATQLLLGATARSRWQRLVNGSVIETVIRRAGDVDVHVIATTAAPGERAPARRRAPRSSLSWRRRMAGALFAALLLPVTTAVGLRLGEGIELSTIYLAFLIVTVAATALGGTLVGVPTAVVAFLLENFFFVEPVRTFTVTDPEHVVSLLGYLAFATAASAAAQRIATRNREASRARTEAEALARTAGALAGGTDTLPALMDNVRTTFALDAVALLRRGADGWTAVAASGTPVPAAPEDGEHFRVAADTELVLVGAGIETELRRLIDAFVQQAATALEHEHLRRDAAKAEVVAQGDALRIGLLRSVSHDLRTPLAAIKASVTGLLADDVEWTVAERDKFLEAIDDECDRLDRLVTNLLDASRLQAGAVAPLAVPTSIDDIVAAALDSLPPSAAELDIDLPPTLPDVLTDPVLAERVLANVLANAMRYSPPGHPARVCAGVIGDRVEVLVVDRGPGIPPAQRAAALGPFQRLGDTDSNNGVGLGLSVASGLVAVLQGELRLDETPGGGLTVVVSLPRSPGS